MWLRRWALEKFLVFCVFFDVGRVIHEICPSRLYLKSKEKNRTTRLFCWAMNCRPNTVDKPELQGEYDIILKREIHVITVCFEAMETYMDQYTVVKAKIELQNTTR